jgi:hypothetical protein
MRRAIAPTGLETQHAATVSALFEAVVGEGWARAVAHKLFEALALLRAERYATVQVEAIHARAQLAAAFDALRGGGEVPRERDTELDHRPALRRAESDTLRDRTLALDPLVARFSRHLKIAAQLRQSSCGSRTVTQPAGFVVTLLAVCPPTSRLVTPTQPDKPTLLPDSVTRHAELVDPPAGSL